MCIFSLIFNISYLFRKTNVFSSRLFEHLFLFNLIWFEIRFCVRGPHLLFFNCLALVLWITLILKVLLWFLHTHKMFFSGGIKFCEHIRLCMLMLIFHNLVLCRSQNELSLEFHFWHMKKTGMNRMYEFLFSRMIIGSNFIKFDKIDSVFLVL